MEAQKLSATPDIQSLNVFVFLTEVDEERRAARCPDDSPVGVSSRTEEGGGGEGGSDGGGR